MSLFKLSFQRGDGNEFDFYVMNNAKLEFPRYGDAKFDGVDFDKYLMSTVDIFPRENLRKIELIKGIRRFY